jgi:hypothetical protein
VGTSGYLGYGLQFLRGKRQSSTGFPTPGVGLAVDASSVVDGDGKVAADRDSLGHVVGKGSLPEDCKAEEVDVDLPDSPNVVPSHMSTSLGSLGLDSWFGKD